jgi:predicted nucleic-acid-binding Zn-ribbon protein
MSRDKEIKAPPAEATASAPAPTVEQRARANLREKYSATIRRLWVHEPDDCPICGSNFWTIGDAIDAPLRRVAPPDARAAIIAQLGGTQLSSATYEEPQVYVYVPVSCLICGYTVFFHSGILDVRDAEEIKTIPPVRRPEREAEPE